MNTFLSDFLGECRDLLASLETTAGELAIAIQQDITARRALREAEEMLAGAEAELVAEAAITAKAGGESPLAGLAATSKPYAAAIDAMLVGARRNGLSSLAQRVADLRLVVDDTEATRQTWATRYSALRHAAELRAAMLKAYSQEANE